MLTTLFLTPFPSPLNHHKNIFHLASTCVSCLFTTSGRGQKVILTPSKPITRQQVSPPRSPSASYPTPYLQSSSLLYLYRRPVRRHASAFNSPFSTPSRQQTHFGRVGGKIPRESEQTYLNLQSPQPPPIPMLRNLIKDILFLYTKENISQQSTLPQIFKTPKIFFQITTTAKSPHPNPKHHTKNKNKEKIEESKNIPHPH